MVGGPNHALLPWKRKPTPPFVQGMRDAFNPGISREWGVTCDPAFGRCVEWQYWSVTLMLIPYDEVFKWVGEEEDWSRSPVLNNLGS